MSEQLPPLDPQKDLLEKSSQELIEVFRGFKGAWQAQVSLVQALYRHDAQKLSIVLGLILRHDIQQNGDGSGKILEHETVVFLRKEFPAQRGKRGELDERRSATRNDISGTFARD